MLGAASPALLVALAAALASPGASGGEAPRRRLDEARALQQQGDARGARERLEALAADLRPRGAAPELGAALLALSDLAMARGDYEAAGARGAEAAEVYRALADRGRESRALNHVGLAHAYRGDYARALAEYDRALALSRASGDGEQQVEQLDNVGSVYFLQARYVEAWRAYRAAEAIAAAAAGAPWQADAQRLTLVNLAALYQRLGAYDQALEVYRRLRASPETLAASEQARTLTNLGALYRRLEDPVKALEAYSAAQQLFARDAHLDGEVKVLKNIGIVQALDLEDPAAALDAFTRALALAEQNHDAREVMQARLYRGETLVRLGRLEDARRDLDAALAGAERLGTGEERWKALYALGRVARASGHDEAAAARFREAVAVIESVRSRVQLGLKGDFLADKRDVYDALVEMGIDRLDAAEVFALLERSRARTFQDRLQERADRAPIPAATLASVQARLAPDALLLEYWVADGGAAVVWVGRGASGVARIPWPAAAQDELAALASGVSSASGEGWRAAARSVGARLLSAVEPLRDPGLRHLLVVPDGPLSAVPFDALELPGGGGALAVERVAVTYLPSAALLLRPAPAEASAWSFPWDRRLLAFGDPTLARSAPGALDAALGAEDRRSLPASAEEVRAVARLVGGRADLHLGREDLKRALLQAGGPGAAPLLHLGTHAMADPANPERSRILFSPASAGEPADYLFLKEVYDLDLRGVDLATLSACETEVGKVVRGEGLQAFSRALLAAGSRASVTTLWRVADGPTAELMKQFYYELSRGEAKAEALRRAKLRLLRSGSALAHPRFWAAFVLSGDGLRPIPRLVPWSALVAPLVAAALAAAAAIALARRRRATSGGARPAGVEGSAGVRPWDAARSA